MSVDSRLVWLALGGFVGANESFAIGSLLPAISAEMGVSLGQAGLVVFAHALAYAIGTPILATVFGRLDRRTLLAGAEAAFAVFALLIALSPSFGWLVAGRVGIGLSAGLFSATAIATAVAISPIEHRGRAIGTVASGQSLAVLVGVPAAAFVAASFGWHLLYFIAAALAALAAVAIRLRLPANIPGDLRALGERLKVLRVPGVPVTLLIMLFFMVAAFVPLTFIAPLAFHSAAVGPDLLPFVLLANGIGAVVGTNLGGRIADALGARRMVIALSTALLMMLVLLSGVPFLTSILALPALLATMGALGFIGWSFFAAHSSLIAGVAGPAAALAIALNLTALNIGVAISAFVGGATLDRFGPATLVLVALLFALLALALAAVRRLSTK